MEFMLGCNYWASNAGTEMWVQWDEAAVEADMKRMAQHGLKYLRVFPNWRDFQPVCAFYAGGGAFKEYRNTKGEFFDNPYYIDMDMMKKFERFCEIANKYGIKFIVGLLTGWMSGRLFVPPVLQTVNVMTDATALELEHKFVKGFVRHFTENEAIFAWDLGNECNCMSDNVSRAQASVWAAFIADTIKVNDTKNRPIVSGMHGLGVDYGSWLITDQAEHTDILTTHPYPQFVPHCSKDRFCDYRTLLHATSQSTLYKTMGKKPCLAEEIGTLGNSFCDDETSAAFLRTNLYSNWANGIMGVLWWCANEQIELTTAPYTWEMMERELGLFRVDGSPKPIALEYKEFAQFLKDFNDELPAVKSDACCVLTQQQDQWGVAYMSYLLAKQAGVNISYSSHTLPLPDSDIYLLPSIVGFEVISKERFDDIMAKVNDGATLYISSEAPVLARFEAVTGVHIRTTYNAPVNSYMEFDGVKIDFSKNTNKVITSDCAIACDPDGTPVFTKHKYGKGTVYFLNFSLENMLLPRSNFETGEHYRIYKEVFSQVLKKRIATRTNKYIGLTLHEKQNECYAVLINYSDKEQKTGFEVKDGYQIKKVIKGNPDLIAPNDAAVVLLEKK